MQWHGASETESGVSARDFSFELHDQTVPGRLWLPAGHTPAPLVLLGYGSGGHARDGSRTWQAQWFATRGIAAASMDLPGHGQRALEDDSLDYGIVADQIVEEWTRCLDLLASLPEIDATRVAYRGMSMGTMLGLPFVAHDPRIVVAALGLADLENIPGRYSGTGDRLRRDAPGVRCPTLFVINWDDELVDRDSAFELFDALGTPDKEFRAYPGRHGEISSAATESGLQYLLDHLQTA
jgi:dienelactone hydrolase